jgi:transketolase
MALAGRIQQRAYNVYAVLSDGECNEGSVWEAAMLAAAQRVTNLCIIIDFNKWQATGRSREVMALDPLADKWRAFGWNAIEVDGHDMTALLNALQQHPAKDGRPTAIIAHTVKGKGVSFMEDDNNWHYKIPSAEHVAAARLELKVST